MSNIILDHGHPSELLLTTLAGSRQSSIRHTHFSQIRVSSLPRNQHDAPYYVRDVMANPGPVGASIEGCSYRISSVSLAVAAFVPVRDLEGKGLLIDKY